MTRTRHSRTGRRTRERRRALVIGALAGGVLLVGLLASTRADDSSVVVKAREGAVVSGVTIITAEVQTRVPVAYVVFRVNGEGWGSTNRRPYQLELDTAMLANGVVEIVAEAYSRGALIARSAPLRVTVSNTPATQPAKAIGEGQKQQSDSKSESDKQETAPEPARPGTPVRPVRPVSEPAPAVAGRALPGAVHGADTATPAEVGGAARATAAAHRSAPRSGQAAGAATPGTAGAGTASTAAAVGPASAAPAREGGTSAAVWLNNEPLDIATAHDIRHGRLYVGFRALMEHLGARVGWEHQTKQAWADWNDRRLAATVGRTAFTIDGVSYTLGTHAVLLMDGRTLVPLRSYGDALGFQVRWDALRRSAFVRLPQADTSHAELLPLP